jgi:DNA invertase Pin-like site-specific DNA recombinase
VQENKGHSRGRPPSGVAPSKKTLLRLYIESGMSIREIAEALNCSKDMVVRSLRSYGIKARKKVRRSALEKYSYELLDASVRTLGVRGTAKELGVNPSTLSRFLRAKVIK